MNSERIVHRKARRRLAENTLILSENGVPYEVFRAAAFTDEQAATEQDAYNLAVEVRAAREGE